MNNKIIDTILTYAEDYNLYKEDNELNRANKYRNRLFGAIKIVEAIGGLVECEREHGIIIAVIITLDNQTTYYKYDDYEFIRTETL